MTLNKTSFLHLLLLVISGQLFGQTVNVVETSYFADQPQQALVELYKVQTSTWDTSALYLQRYGGNGLANSQLISQYQNGILDREIRMTYAYDSSGNRIYELRENLVNGLWENFSKNELTFDHNNDWISLEEQAWNGSQWEIIFASRRLVHYNSLLQPVEYTLQTMDSTLTYTNESRGIFKYNLWNELDSILSYNLSTNNSFPSSYEVYPTWEDYAQGKPHRADVFIWLGNRYGLYTSKIYRYDANSRLQSSDFEWNGFSQTSTQWEHVEYDSLGYAFLDSVVDIVGQNSQLLYSYRRNFTRNSQGKLSEVFISSFSNGNYVPFEKWTFDDFVLSETEGVLPKLQFEFGPNPARTFLNIRLSEQSRNATTVQLYDLQGRLRLEMIDPHTDRNIALQLPETLPAGSYLLVVQTGKGQATAKIQILR